MEPHKTHLFNEFVMCAIEKTINPELEGFINHFPKHI